MIIIIKNLKKVKTTKNTNFFPKDVCSSKRQKIKFAKFKKVLVIHSKNSNNKSKIVALLMYLSLTVTLLYSFIWVLSTLDPTTTLDSYVLSLFIEDLPQVATFIEPII